MKDPFKLNAKSIMALYELFPTEEACIKHLEAINWHGKPVSPFDKISKVYKLKSGKYRCKNTLPSVLEPCLKRQKLVYVNGLLPFGS